MIPDFAGCKTQMYNARRDNFPPLPKTKEEVNLEGIWTETTNGRRIVLHQDQEMIILSTDNSLQILATTGTQLMYGTFKAAPKIPNLPAEGTKGPELTVSRPRIGAAPLQPAKVEETEGEDKKSDTAAYR